MNGSVENGEDEGFEPSCAGFSKASDEEISGLSLEVGLKGNGWLKIYAPKTLV